jgi:hypothetical protein
VAVGQLPTHFPSALFAGTFAQVPACPATLHDWQSAQLAAEQQVPSTQLPLTHWLPALHAKPFDFFWQKPPMQL